MYISFLYISNIFSIYSIIIIIELKKLLTIAGLLRGATHPPENELSQNYNAVGAQNYAENCCVCEKWGFIFIA